MRRRIPLFVVCVLAVAQHSYGSFDISRRGAVASPPDPAIEQTYAGTEAGRTAALALGPSIHAYGDGASGAGWVSSSSFYYRPFPNSGGSSGDSIWADDLTISAPELAGQTGTLRARVGVSTFTYGNFNNVILFRGGAALSSGLDFDNAQIVTGNQPGSAQVFDLELQFTFGEQIALTLTADSQVDGSARSGGWAAASWRGITDVLDSSGNSVIDSSSSFLLSSLGNLSVTSSSGFDYTQAAEDFEVVVVPEPTMATAMVAVTLFLCRRPTAKRRAGDKKLGTFVVTWPAGGAR